MRSVFRPIALAICGVLLVGGAISEAARPKKGRSYSMLVPSTGPTGIGGTEDAEVFSLVVSKKGKKVLVVMPSMCGRNPRGKIPGITLSTKGKFSGKRKYTDTRPSGEKFAWDLKVSGRFTSRTKAKGVLTIHLETSDYNRGESDPGVESVCNSPKNFPWSAKIDPL